jgi:hypothetical protein
MSAGVRKNPRTGKWDIYFTAGKDKSGKCKQVTRRGFKSQVGVADRLIRGTCRDPVHASGARCQERRASKRLTGFLRPGSAMGPTASKRTPATEAIAITGSLTSTWPPRA